MYQTVSLVAAPVIFGVCAYFTRASRRRIAIGVAGGLVFALGNVGWDAFAERMDWWRYPKGATPLWYIAAGMAFAGLSLIAWRLDRRAGTRGLVWFFVLLSLYGVARDFVLSRFMRDLIVFGSGVMPWVVDFAAWLSLAVFAVGVQVEIEPNARAD